MRQLPLSIKLSGVHRIPPQLLAPPPPRAGWLPLLAGVLLCLLVAALWWKLEQRERANLHSRIQSQAIGLVSQIQADFRSRIPTLQRMVRRWEYRGGMPEAEFLAEAQQFLSDLPAFQAIERVDRDFTVRWLTPLQGNEPALNLNLGLAPQSRTALERAEASYAPAMTAPLDLIQGGKGFLVSLPLITDHEPDGFIVAVFRFQDWLDHVLSVEDEQRSAKPSDYQLEFLIDSLPVHKRAATASIVSSLEATASTKLLGHRIEARVCPTHHFASDQRTLLPKVVAGLGLILSLLIVAVVALFQKASRERATAQAARTNVEVEQRNLKAIFESSPVGLMVLDENANVTMANDAALHLVEPASAAPLPRKPGEILGCVHHRDSPQGCGRAPQCALCPLRRALNSVITHGATIRNLEFAMDVLSDGQPKTIWLTLGAGSLFIQNRRLVALSLHDITARKETEEALKRSEERIRLLLNSTGEAIYGIGMHGECTFANAAFLKMLGYHYVGQLLGQDMHRLVHHSREDGRPMHLIDCRVHKAIQTGEPQHVDDEVFWRADGSSFPVEYWSYPQLVNGEIRGAVVAFVDITERKRTEQELKESRLHLERLNQTLQQRVDDTVAELRKKDQVLIHQGRRAAMGEMIGNIAHQWRQPLNALSMLITNIQCAQSAGEMTEAYMDESVATANRLIQKMSSTINDFRNFFSPDKQKVDFSVLEQIRHVVSLVDASFRSNRIELVVDETVDCTLKGYPNEYSQVLLNLLSNAKEAIAEKGIVPGRVTIAIKREATMGVVTVSDNGGGIPEHLLGRLFEPYFTTKSKGTGIGLYMSQMIIERNMDGTILAGNIEGGSIFTVSVPLGETAPAPPPVLLI